ncbi:hypothetical protein HY492_00125 [Candidatus Woesearchaeota archaeon]|nr:hypothetical protein [Candidatus Woesearchaeota archaeon]
MPVKQTDVSKKTLVVLVFLVILVTMFSTWAVLSANTPNIVRTSNEAKGFVMLQIVGTEPKAPSSTANIVLELAP